MPLVEQKIPTLFNGVSRQPAPVRLTSQMEAADNVYPSVSTGGFEKRPATLHIASLSSTTTTAEYQVYAIDRDETEKYIVLFGGNTVHVYDAFTGAIKTTNYSSNATASGYLTGTASQMRLSTIVDTSFLANSGITVAMDQTPFGREIQSSVSVTSATWSVSAQDIVLHIQASNSVALGDWFRLVSLAGSVTPTELNNVWVRVSSDIDATHWDGVLADADATIAGSTYDYGEGNELIKQAPFDVQAFKLAHGTTGTVTNGGVLRATTKRGLPDGTKNSFSALPATPTDTHVYKINPAPDDDAGAYYVQYSSSSGVWRECPKPGDLYIFDYDTLPLVMSRESDGTFSIYQWNENRFVDDTDHAAGFTSALVDSTINDITFFRNRLAMLSDESVVTTQNGDVFELFPAKASLSLATDPVELTASGADVNILKWAVPFLKQLFVTSIRAQFECSGDLFTPDDAKIDPSTKYEADVACKPVVMGEQLFFPAKTDAAGIIYEYYLDENTLSNTAGNANKHCEGYLPPGCKQLTTASVPERLFVLPEDARNHIYVYTSYWNGTDKVQAAWTRLIFGDDETDAYIHGIVALGNWVYIVVRRPGGVFLERFAADTEASIDGLGFAPLLDRRTEVTGVYNTSTQQTTWTVPYLHDDSAVVVTGEGFDSGERGYVPEVEYPTTTTIRADGDFSEDACYIGIPYLAYGELSKIYMRDQNGTARTTGRLSIRSIAFDYKDSGYFEVWVTPEGRDTDVTTVTEFTGRNLHEPDDFGVGEPVTLSSGVHQARVGGRADKTRIAIASESHLPFIITGATWVGNFVPRVRDQQGQG